MTTALQNVQQAIEGYYQENPAYKFDASNPIVRLHEPTFGAAETFAATETMLSTFVTMGKKVKAFEKKYAEVEGFKYALMNNSGSSANLLAIAALCSPLTQDGLKAGDEVLVPALSWSTTIWPLLQHGLVPVFIDCDLETLNMDLAQAEAAITSKTRAIMPIHTYGNPCDIDTMMDLVNKHNLILIEDSCETMGGRYKGKATGSFGRVGTFSTYFSHHITTLEGGICVTEDFDLLEVMRVQRAHGWSREGEKHAEYVAANPTIDPRFIFVDTGYNLRPTEVQAAMGLIQIDKLASINKRRQRAAEQYKTRFAQYSNWLHIQKSTEGAEHVWFGLPIILDESAPFELKEITQFIQSKNIETRPVIAGNMTRHPVMKGKTWRQHGELPNADVVMSRGFALPCHHDVCEDACTYVCDVVDQFMAQYTATAAA
ncbi:MAG: aminotransferase class I/II-fold pyridoxal phosphate-dependent enzyme [Alphaproteobacteria bacterium]|nr:aminotransferase class I/II-fold pyridoxal phosphate-dependent enzyme [Alphaproteobacteria bacterium]MDD9919856.1 aminotransferase class I/II-fold pyridoxal phosphate-dependent enzyme [Alphaproteobacteria bacterium]